MYGEYDRDENYRSEENSERENTGYSAGDGGRESTGYSAGDGFRENYEKPEERTYRINTESAQASGTGSFANGKAEEPVHREHKKRGGFLKRTAAIAASALLFGGIAGGTIAGINNMAARYQAGILAAAKPAEPVIEKAETKSTEAALISRPEIQTAAVVSDVSGIVEKAMPSVVAINGTTEYQTQSWFGQTQTYEAASSGSGIIIGKNDDELLIVTNNHVIEDTKSLSVVFINDKEIEATVKGGDSETDVAVIAVKLADIPEDTMPEIEVASIGDSDSLKVGQGVVAIGNALGYGQSVTVGYISALDREVQVDRTTTRNLLQTDAAINPGNSGGALLNMNGEVIGINSAKYSSTEVEGMGYAIPISKAQDIITELSNKETRSIVDESEQGTLGIQGQNIDEEMSAAYDIPRGIYVYKILEGGAAASSELQAKDVITKFDGQTVRSMEELKEILTYYKSGSKVSLTVKRLNGSEYEERQVEITLGSRQELE